MSNNMLRKLLLISIIWELGRVSSEEACESISNCQQCIHAPSCGWYLQYRSANGSGCFEYDYLAQEKTDLANGYYHPPRPSFLVMAANDSYPLSPQEVALNLRLNQPYTFPVTFTPRRKEWGKRAVKLRHNIATRGVVNLKFYSNCSNRFDEIKETNECDVEFGSSVEFLVVVEQVRCSRHQPESIKRILIYPSPSGAALRLNVYAYCYCPCEMDGRRGNPDPPRVIPDCRKRGTFTCGVCYCEDGWAGKDCEINTTNTI
ncbi:hypothetical protein MTP99_013672 [Tenebrio molitor]|jgi:hypothetical protein|nr:hypothetical protein MTP99_013672 [Tenebrio molitor]